MKSRRGAKAYGQRIRTLSAPKCSLATWWAYVIVDECQDNCRLQAGVLQTQFSLTTEGLPAGSRRSTAPTLQGIRRKVAKGVQK